MPRFLVGLGVISVMLFVDGGCAALAYDRIPATVDRGLIPATVVFSAPSGRYWAEFEHANRDGPATIRLYCGKVHDKALLYSLAIRDYPATVRVNERGWIACVGDYYNAQRDAGLTLIAPDGTIQTSLGRKVLVAPDEWRFLNEQNNRFGRLPYWYDPQNVLLDDGVFVMISRAGHRTEIRLPTAE